MIYYQQMFDLCNKVSMPERQEKADQAKRGCE
jgi:hypothetical protein